MRLNFVTKRSEPSPSLWSRNHMWWQFLDRAAVNQGLAIYTHVALNHGKHIFAEVFKDFNISIVKISDVDYSYCIIIICSTS